MTDIKYCEYCAQELTEKGRCPDEACVYNVYIDAIAECDEKIKQEKGELNDSIVAGSITGSI